MKPEEFEKAVQGGEAAAVYYLYGDEPYLIERAAKRLLDRVLHPDFRDFNYNLFYGNECKSEEILEAASTLPMFADRRVVLVKRSSGLPAATLEMLTPYIENPAPSSCLIFQGDKIDLRKKFFTSLKKQGALVEFRRLYENQIVSFIRQEVAAGGKKIEGAAAELLGYMVGTNLRELVSQLEKLAVYVGDRPDITVVDVRQIVSDTKVESVFEFANALGERHLGKSLRALHTILRDGEAPLMVLAVVTRHFRQLWQVRELTDRRMQAADISKAAGINPYFLKGIMEQARNFRPVELKEIFERFYATDLGLKSGGGKPAFLMEMLAIDICGNR
ncbi:DNA polymerase III subunit delta [Geobacter sp. DSM 9736]|uniref:DNA polymerase III subunit delta n=1 Tax=Geobacter sp. DSM 9736 TaxID=1277350 RepID=UPI000B512D9F|nr:DNA polymerase III subunit delta [Geobacter sp. DSM 9736]SNB45099.1 DNA polymerase III, delta subunit [Geobacter sp. DSM 9736]